jgi:glycosyltransferase involved in cell wall biosynthesis
VYEQVQKHTDLSDAEFYFVANDACDKVKNHLVEKNIPHYIHENTAEQRDEWYINNCYRAWNKGMLLAKGEYVILVNSDMAFSPGWLDRLTESVQDGIVVGSRLVERGVLRSGQYGIEQNFGNVPEDYNEDGFLQFVERIRSPILAPGGLFAPILMKKEYVEKVGYYPEGNLFHGSDTIIAKKGEPCVSGDYTFMLRLAAMGIKHYTNFNSIVYHFQEGEMRDTLG